MSLSPNIYLEYTKYNPFETFEPNTYELHDNFNPFETLDIFTYKHQYTDRHQVGGTAENKQNKQNRQNAATNKKTKIPGIDFPLQDGRTALHIAAEKGQIQATRSLLKAGANTNVYDKKGNSPLHEASQRGHKQIVRLLLEDNAFINIPNHSGSLPIHLAAINGHEDTVQILTGNDPSTSNHTESDNQDSISTNNSSKDGSKDIKTDLTHTKKPVDNQINKHLEGGDPHLDDILKNQNFENIKEGEEREVYLPSQPNFNNFLFPTSQTQPNNKEGLFAKLGKKMLSKTMSFLQPKTPFM